MNTQKRTLILILFLPFYLFFIKKIEAQNKQQAKKMYERHEYKSAIKELQNAKNLAPEEMQKIADGYRLNHDTRNAELWYAQIIEKNNNPKNTLYYAQALQSNGKYEEAKIYYLKYDDLLGGDNEDQRGKMLAAAIDRMNEVRNNDAQINNEYILNSEKLDFSPAYYNNGVVFVSTRQPESQVGLETKKDLWTDDLFMTLFYSKINIDGTLTKPKEFSERISSVFHEGPVSFNRSGDRIFFTRNHFNKGKREDDPSGIMKLQIYTAIKVDNEWVNVEELPFNTVENEEAHPSLSPDGRSLYFASNRAGGYGGMDIYVSTFKNGNWEDPINLGENVNTSGNELFPFIADDGTLYFASNGWEGLGGLDIYSTNLEDAETKNNWSAAENIGTPFNSPKDDFGFILNITGTEGFFSSAREGGLGQDDIYSFVMGASARLVKTSICVQEINTNEKIAAASLQITAKTKEGEDPALQYKETLETNERGMIVLYLEPNTTYDLKASKNGYSLGQQTISIDSEKDRKGLNTCVAIEESNCAILQGTTINERYNKPIPNVKLNILNFCTGESTTLFSDKNGAFEVACLECGCEYEVKASKENFGESLQMLSALEGNCNRGEVINMVLGLGFNQAKPEKEEVVLPIAVEATPPPPAPIVPVFEGKKLEIGSKIQLKNIYYDLNSADLRYESTYELDKIVRLMQEYPNLKIELSSHTDARGSSKYNQKLSHRRAKSAVDYIVNHGISTYKIVARGHGERFLVNDCDDETRCSENDHQQNRRTEIKVLSIGTTPNKAQEHNAF